MSRPSYLTQEAIHHFIREALAEDIGPGDFSTLGAVPAILQGKARLLVKDEGILAGVELAAEIFNAFDPTLRLDIILADGASVKKGDVAFVVHGKVQSILTTERLVLNCMQRMSGIATKARELTQLLEGTQARLMDTRKTTPNFRLMEKWAVWIGGALNHRFALYDMVMLKDNHNDSAGGITQAVSAVKAFLQKEGKNLKIEVETRTLAEVEEALQSGADIIMLDNMSPEEMKNAVALVNGRCPLEASGSINKENLRAVADTGVDFISMGALTYSVRSLDLSLKIF